MSKNSVSNRRVCSSGVSLTWMAVAESQVTPTQRSPMPRIVKLDAVKLPLLNDTFGRVSWRSLEFSICWRSIACEEKALTAIGTSCSDSAWRWAVTMMVSIPESSCSVTCANAGEAMRTASADALQTKTLRARKRDCMTSTLPRLPLHPRADSGVARRTAEEGQLITAIASPIPLVWHRNPDSRACPAMARRPPVLNRYTDIADSKPLPECNACGPADYRFLQGAFRKTLQLPQGWAFP